MGNSNVKKYFGDGLLIVFSVLFALFINSLAEKRAIKNKKDIALSSIKKELLKNKEILEVWHSNHSIVSSRMDSLVNGLNDSLIDDIKKNDQLNLGLLFGNKTLVQELISKTAWETAKSTGIVAEFDYDTIEKLTEAYTIQDEVTEHSLRSVLALYFDRESHKMENLLSTINQFDLRFMNLVGQEIGLLYLCDLALEDLE